MTRILIVDDSAIDRKLAGSQIEKHTDWTIEYATNGLEGLEAIRRDQPDLVLTDMQMPEMDGLELCQAVRREFPGVSVILMTARGSEEIAMEALQAGAASYVPKRSLRLQLVETARRVLSARQDDRVQREVLRRMQSRVETVRSGKRSRPAALAVALPATGAGITVGSRPISADADRHGARGSFAERDVSRQLGG